MFYGLHAVQGTQLANENYKVLWTTLFSLRQLLLGVSAEGTIVVRRDYENETPLEGTYNYLAAKFTHHDGRSDIPYYRDCNTAAYNAAVHFKPKDTTNFTILGDTSHDVVAWHFIGVDHSEETEVSADPEIGQFYLGASLDESTLTASGRMWLKWSCAPMTVTPTTLVSFGFAGEDGNYYNESTVGYVGGETYRESDWTSTRVPYRADLRYTPNMVIPVGRLFNRRTDENVVEAQARFISDFGKTLSQQLMTSLFGADEPFTPAPYAEPPAPVSTLWESTAIEHEFNTVMDGWPTDLKKLAVSDYVDRSRLVAYAACHSKTAQTFTFPTETNKGVKISLRVRNRRRQSPATRGYSFSFKCHRDDQPTVVPHEKQSIFMLTDYAQDLNAGFVGGYNPQQDLHLTDGRRSFHVDGLEGFKAAGVNNELYEAYVMGDGHAYLYINGAYVGRYIMTPETIARGAEYTFSLYGYEANVTFDELKVEAFDFPVDYVAPVDAPDVYAFAAWTTYNGKGYTPNIKPALFDGETYYPLKPYYIDLYTHDAHYVDFSVTAPMQLRAYSGMSHSTFDLINLTTGEETEVYIPVRQWGSISDNLTAGRWRLRGKTNYTALTQFEINPPILPVEPEPEPEPETAV